MGFFNSNASVSGSAANIEDLLNEDLNTYEGMSIMEANYAIIAENEMNWNAIMEAAAATEMSYFAENGEEYVYTEASGFFGKISEFFKKIWEKVKGLFKKFMVMIGSLWTKDKEFVKKYGETIRRNMKNIPNDYDFKGYKFEKGIAEVQDILSKASKKIESASSDLSAAAGSFNPDACYKAISTIGIQGYDANDLLADDFDATDANEKARGAIIGKTGTSFTSAEFSKEVSEMLRGGESSPIDIPLNSGTVSQALSDLENAKQPRKDANDAYKKGEAAFKKVIQNMEKIEGKGYSEKPADGKDNSTKLKALNRAINCLKSVSNDYTTLNSLFLTAVKDKYNQDKRMCVKVVTFRTAKNEGASVEHFTEGSAFAGLNLI